MTRANDRQVGGDHYKQYGKLQPWDVIQHFKLDFLGGNVFKYLIRYEEKDGLQDLEKARHYLDKLIEQLKARQPKKKRKAREAQRSSSTQGVTHEEATPARRRRSNSVPGGE